MYVYVWNCASVCLRLRVNSYSMVVCFCNIARATTNTNSRRRNPSHPSRFFSKKDMTWQHRQVAEKQILLVSMVAEEVSETRGVSYQGGPITATWEGGRVMLYSHEKEAEVSFSTVFFFFFFILSWDAKEESWQAEENTSFSPSLLHFSHIFFRLSRMQQKGESSVASCKY